MDRREVFEKIKELGADEAVAYFSGGNDEGFVNSVKLVNSSTGGVDIDDELREDIEAPIWDRWGTFSGDFSVYGKCVWKDGKVTLDYEETEYVSYSDEV